MTLLSIDQFRRLTGTIGHSSMVEPGVVADLYVPEKLFADPKLKMAISYTILNFTVTYQIDNVYLRPPCNG